MRTAFLLALVLLGVHWNQAQAQEEKWTHYGLRPLAMGNAYVAVADDFNALFYNPAGLARLEEWDGELLNPTMEISAATTSFITDIQNLASGSAGDTEAVLDMLEEQSGTVQHFALGLTPHLIFPNFGLGIGMELASTMVFHRYPTIDLDVGPRVIIPIAYAHSFFEDRLSLGFGVKARVRGGINREFSIQDIEAFTSSDNDDEEETTTDTEEDEVELSDYIEGGVGYGADFGVLFTPIKPMEPTLGISITDIGGTSYEEFDVSGEALGAPAVELPSVNVGVSFKPWKTKMMYLLLASDAHSINQPYSFSKKLNFGMEFGYSSIIKTQLGLHQGYLSGGLQFDVRYIVIRLASYAEEMGSAAGTIEDRRYALQLKLII